MEEADTIIYFDLPRWVTIYRIIKRRIQYHGKTRPDLNERCPEKLHWEFIKWVWNYKKTKRPRIIAKLEKHAIEKKIIILRSQKEVSRLIETIQHGKELISNL
jgi:adenylate kinase family enzyme